MVTDFNKIDGIIDLGDQYRHQGNHDVAIVTYQKARELIDKIGANLNLNESKSFYLKGDLVGAETCARKSLKIYQSISDKDGEACAQIDLAKVCIANNNYAEAESYINDVIKIANEIYKPNLLINAYALQGIILSKIGWDIEAANVLYFACSALSTEGIENKKLKGDVLKELGTVFCKDGFRDRNVVKGKHYLKEALATLNDLGDKDLSNDIESILDKIEN